MDKIQENLYSRQIGTYGEEAMKKILNLKILILGLKGLGIEVAKNIILTGPEKVIIYDPNIVQSKDLGLNYYLHESDINKNRIDYSCINSLANLNPNTKVEIFEITDQKNFYQMLNRIKLDVIIETEFISKKDIVSLNEYCREKSIKFIYGVNMGLSGFIFSDFSNEHTIYDIDGEEPSKFLIKEITNENKSKVTIEEEDDNPLNLDEGDFIIFKNVKGMVELNDNKPRKILSVENKVICIDENTNNYHKFEGNGDLCQYKLLNKMKYLSFKNSIELPFIKEKIEQNFTEQQERKLHENKLYLAIIITLEEFLDKGGNIEKIKNNEIVNEIMKEAELKFHKMIEREKELGLNYEDYEENEIQKFEEKKVYNILFFSKFNLAPMCSLIGGYISQEIIKSIGKYYPINQWMFFDFYDDNFSYGVIKTEKNIINRYYDQIHIFGDEIQEKIKNLKIFACGAGAVGCELLKNLSLMGIATGKDGCVSITDYDCIENSNLNRQFLFNNKNINQPKSKIACETIKKMNPEFNCENYQLKICEETENVFNDTFWEKQDIIVSGVDDNKARMYLNNQCFKYNKILLNIGTSGVRAKADIVIPKKTYPLQIILNEGESNINVCTIKKFPYKIEHCIQWSKEIFYFLFQENIKIYNNFISDEKKFIEDLLKEPQDVINKKFKIIKAFSEILICENNSEKNKKIINLCVYYFYQLFVNSIESLLRFYPQDSKKEGVLFWSGAKKMPSVIKSLDINDPMTKQFLYCFNFILCQCLKIEFNEDIFSGKNLGDFLKEKFDEYKNKKNEEILNENEVNSNLNEIKKNLSELKKYKLNEIVFEKDGLNNNHLEFIQACSNLRARNYNIQEENKNKILMIAGKIIAAVPTSTSSIVGYVCLQIINLLYTHDTENVVKNAFFNLGLNAMDLIPQEQIEQKIEEEKEEIEKYPKIQIQGSKTCSEFIEYIKGKYNYEIFHFEINDKILYDKRVSKNPKIIKREMERNQKKIEDLYFEQIKKTNEKIDLNQKNLNIKVNCRIKNDKDEIIENIYDFPLIDYIFE